MLSDGKEAAVSITIACTLATREREVELLLKVEQNEDLTEIVAHVNMQKEGWDVTNLYTIVPLRVF